MTCEFCSYNTIEPERIVYEDESLMAFTDGTDGKCTVIPKDHVRSVETVENPDRFLLFVQYLSKAIMDALNADDMKNNTITGDHFSICLIPIGGSAPEDFQERIMWNLRNSQWYNTLNG